MALDRYKKKQTINASIWHSVCVRVIAFVGCLNGCVGCQKGLVLGRLGLVALHVQRQVVGARERALAHDALERLGARVLAVVPRQLVRTRKSPLALRPVTPVRLLACNQTIKIHFSNSIIDKTINPKIYFNNNLLGRDSSAIAI